MTENNFDHSRVFKLVSKWDKFINMLEDYVEKQRFGLNETTFNFMKMSRTIFTNWGVLRIENLLYFTKKFINCGLVL